jgi:predicted N-acetyltransferase YhbS
VTVEVRASGREYLALVTQLLQRARLADAEAGLWEAADLQWWWRMPRSSDVMDQLFWIDGDGPVAAVVLTEWRRGWGCDPIAVPGVSPPSDQLWARALTAIDDRALEGVHVLVRDDGLEQTLLGDLGFVADESDRGGITWMGAAERPAVSTLPDGFALVDRETATDPHPMRHRNGEAVEARLRECSLYDPGLDLAVETGDGEVAGYALFWFDPVTYVGLLEPMRVEDAFQRRGLARALLTEGVERLVQRGARRLKVGYSTEPARALYTGAGFRVAATYTAYRLSRAG